jgi:hypothetical protein
MEKQLFGTIAIVAVIVVFPSTAFCIFCFAKQKF